MRGLSVLLLTLLSAFPLAAQQAPPPADSPGEAVKRPLRIAVYDLTAADVEPRVAQLFVNSLLAELRKLQRVSVVSLDEVRALIDLEAQKQLAGCDEGSCLAEIAEALGADALIVGGFARVDNTTALALKRINAQSAEVTSSYTQQLVAARGEELLAAVGPAVERLFSDVPLRPGLVRGVAPEVALRLNPPPVPVWAFGIAAGVAGASLMATGATGAWWITSDQQLRKLYETGKTAAVAGPQIQDQQGTVQQSNAIFWVAAGVTAVLAVAAGVLIPFTDFAGYGAASEGGAL